MDPNLKLISKRLHHRQLFCQLNGNGALHQALYLSTLFNFLHRRPVDHLWRLSQITRLLCQPSTRRRGLSYGVQVHPKNQVKCRLLSQVRCQPYFLVIWFHLCHLQNQPNSPYPNQVIIRQFMPPRHLRSGYLKRQAALL